MKASNVARMVIDPFIVTADADEKTARLGKTNDRADLEALPTTTRLVSNQATLADVLCLTVRHQSDSTVS